MHYILELLKKIKTISQLSRAFIIRELLTYARNIKLFILITLINCFMAFVAFASYYINFQSYKIVSVKLVSAAVLNIYTLLAMLGLLIILVMVPAMGAGAIGKEKDGKTFDLVMSTGIYPVWFVFGKVMSISLYSMLILFACVPVLGIVFFIGGVEILCIIEIVFMNFAISLYIASISVVCSIFFQRVRYAKIFAYVIELFLCFGRVALVKLESYISKLSLPVKFHFVNQDYSEQVNRLFSFNPLYTYMRLISRQVGVLDNNMELFGYYDGEYKPVDRLWLTKNCGIYILISCILLLVSAELLCSGKYIFRTAYAKLRCKKDH